MAYYVPSALAKAQFKLINQFQSGELRAIDPVTFKQFLRNSQFMLPNYMEMRGREDRVLEAYYTLRKARSLTTGRVHNPSGTQGDSGTLTPSFTTYADKFAISLKQGDNNVYDEDYQMYDGLQNMVSNFANGNESLVTDYLYNNRSAVNAATSEGAFNVTTNTFELNDSTVGNRAVQITGSAMNENLWGGYPLTIFCDTIAFNRFRFLSVQGQSNAVNTSFQFDGKTFVNSLYLTAKAQTLGYNKGFWIAVPDGTIGIMDWIPKQNRAGITKAQWSYGTVQNPVDGLMYALFSTFTAQDSSAVGGYTQDILTNYEMSIDLAPQNAPLSKAGETTIQAFGLI